MANSKHEQRVDDLALTWKNGNRKDVVEAILEESSKAEAAHLTLLVAQKIPMGDIRTLEILLESRF